MKILLVVIFSGFLFANAWAHEGKAANFVSLSAEQANSSVFYSKMPSGSTARVSLAVNDKFVSSLRMLA